jgi:RNA polymerase sigma-70 factor, ECF subfamily
MAEDPLDAPSGSKLTALRPLMFSIAYRMLGSIAEAEDIVQEAMLRFHQAHTGGVVIESPKAYVAAVTTRLAIDHLRSARVRRESYVGPWLPEPIVEEREPAMARHAEMAESLSMAFMVMLETMSPLERAVFLLREVFEYGYEEIAAVVDKTEQNCRQIFARAKRHLEVGKPRFEASREKRDELAYRFFSACQDGHLEDMVHLLAADAAFFGDGGGKATAFTKPVLGQDRVVRLLQGMFAKGRVLGVRLKAVDVNGQPGAMFFDAEDRLINVMAVDIADGVVYCVRSIVNPDKLGHLGPLSDLTRLPSRPE